MQTRQVDKQLYNLRASKLARCYAHLKLFPLTALRGWIEGKIEYYENLGVNVTAEAINAAMKDELETAKIRARNMHKRNQQRMMPKPAIRPEVVA